MTTKTITMPKATGIKISAKKLVWMKWELVNGGWSNNKSYFFIVENNSQFMVTRSITTKKIFSDYNANSLEEAQDYVQNLRDEYVLSLVEVE